MIKLINDDCIKLAEKLPNKSIDLIITDPPYLHVKGGMKSKKYNTGSWKEDSYMNTEMSDFNEKKINEFLDTYIPKMKKINMYIFCSKLQLQYYFKYIYEHKLKYDLLVWDKVRYRMKSTKFFITDIEYIVKIYQDGVSLNKIQIEDGSKADIKYYMKRKSFEQELGEHETMKPIKMIKQFIELSSNEGDLILDPFVGSGTTMVGCKELNRNGIGIEINKKYYDMAKERCESND